MSQSPLFYTPVTALLNGLAGGSTPIAVPWVTSFSQVPAGASICVLTSPSGIFVPGMYMQLPATDGSGAPVWRLALLMANLSAVMANNSTIQLIVNVSTSQTFAAPFLVYCNGQLLSSGVVQTDAGAIYVVVSTPAVLPGTYTVATLPTAASAGMGAQAFVTDATATTFASTVVGSGTNKVPVYSDGTNWKIG